MKTITLFILILVASNTWAAAPAKDVNVINTPSVTVTNLPASVTVDNSATNPVPVSIQGGVSVAPDPQFVGFSSDSVKGNVGLVGMHGACSLTYGTGARMCTDEEVFKTPNLQPVPSVPSGWIQPTSQMMQFDDINKQTCSHWSDRSIGGIGFVLSGERMNIAATEITYSNDSPPNTIYATTRCGDARPVACCM